MTAPTLLLAGPLPDWMADGACTSGPARLLPWIEEPGIASPLQIAAMARVCAGCPVRLACGVEARAMTSGFWAGSQRGTAELDNDTAAAALDGVAVQDTLGLDLVGAA
ncbi:hypothetical protein [Myceligenerans salitolerans]|uniref:4Fe-4S Wbl-type domain-containing protein n=1 Tax=Myceligenerans salitolerans TaxID=1230528 RepID=A0ABS3I9F0_9MICO|nr:hypothetical protein [Myceligenerans salitolerans]MBO0609575.1 hypothetical protein [Myceligenerans salitolerans]